MFGYALRRNFYFWASRIFVTQYITATQIEAEMLRNTESILRQSGKF